MIEPIHSRQEDWEGWPFSSVAELAECAAELEELVREASGGEPPWTSIEVMYEDREYQPKSVEEFAEAADELDMEGLRWVTVMFHREDSDPVGATIGIEGGTSVRRETRLRVSGRRKTAVDGVNVGGKAVIERWVENARERSAHEAASAEPAGSRPTSAQAGWRRFLAHPYSIQIVGGIVAGVVVLVIAVVVFSQGG